MKDAVNIAATAALLAFGLTAPLAAFAEAPPALAAQGVSKEQVERRLVSVGTLIESSSGAKQIEASGSVEAQARRSAARGLHQQAQQAYQVGNLADASRLLDEAAKTMFEGVRLAAPEQITGKKDKSDFDARMDSTRALLDAQKRIAAEKGGGPRAAELSRKIEGLMADASRMASSGKVSDARKTLDQAYLSAKAAIGGMRGGDTLVRSLNFANKEEEYRYEIDRNDTHQMLIKVLLQDKRGDAVIEGQVQKLVSEATRLRQQAEAEAGKRDFDAGVKTLEASTRELVRAIRGAGIYIPE